MNATATLRRLARAASENPVAAASVGTGAVVSFLFWRQYRASTTILMEAQAAMHAETERSTEASKKTIRDLEAQLAVELKRKDDLLQRLQVQNVEQSRSIDRLLGALRVCDVDVPRKVGLTMSEFGDGEAGLASSSSSSS